MKTSTKRIALIVLASVICGLFCSSCRNTVQGVGRDMERAGDRLQDSGR